MANPQKGEVLVKVDGGEFVLVYTLGALAALEGQFPGQTYQDVLAELGGDSTSVQTIMVVVWAGLKKHHDLTLDQVGDLVTLAEMKMWGQKIAEAFKLAQPEAKKGKNPRKALPAQ